MSRLIVTCIADDRFGRKEGVYQDTQDKMGYILKNNPQLGVDNYIPWEWDGITKTPWYESHKILLDNTDAARNGRAYKPYIILEALRCVKDGDYVVYTDCSPEMWNMDKETIYPSMYYNTDVLKRLCNSNNDILTVFVKWDNTDIKEGKLGIHTHKNFTFNRCMDKMGLRRYENSYMHASGMWCIRRTESTLGFVHEWLKWNCLEDCASTGKIDIEDDYSFWEEEKAYKMGHRGDQSISGLLMNKRNAKFVDILYNDMNPYNFLQYTRTDVGYKFIDSNIIPEDIPDTIDESPYSIGDTVTNDKGTTLKVIRIEGNTYIVGKSEVSCYATTKDKLK